MKKILLTHLLLLLCLAATGQTLTENQMRNARASGYAVVAARNPGVDFSILMIPWDGVNTLEYNANTQINSGWHAQAVVKGNFFYQGFDGNDFSKYSTVILSQEKFDQYKGAGTQWWIVCSTLPAFSDSRKNMDELKVSGNAIMNGKVGIGTATLGSHKLAVEGSIGARSVKVEATGWSDFVF